MIGVVSRCTLVVHSKRKQLQRNTVTPTRGFTDERQISQLLPFVWFSTRKFGLLPSHSVGHTGPDLFPFMESALCGQPKKENLPVSSWYIGAG